MIRFLKYLALAVATLVGGYLALMIVVGLIFFQGASDCSADSEAANYARSLEGKRLEKLYRDMEEFYHRESTPYEGYDIYSEEGLPEVFVDLKVNKVRPKQANIMVVGCFDNYMYLQFSGIDEPGEKAIHLTYGEHEITRKVLWPMP